ncbi:MAG TPA: hypothetical protein VGG21_03325 [Acidimicrobiales bacterium]|jgi:hypothetical protein
MRRVLAAVALVAVGLGIYVIPAGADSPVFANVVLSFDFSDNSAPASAFSGTPNSTEDFNVIADVLPGNTGGFVRMVAIAPASSTANNIVCSFQPVQQGQVECAFNFTADGVWSIKAQYTIAKDQDVSSVSVTSLRVAN